MCQRKTNIQLLHTYLEKPKCEDGRRVNSDLAGEPKCLEQRRCVLEYAERGEDEEQVELRYKEKLHRMIVVPVAQLVRYTANYQTLATGTTNVYFTDNGFNFTRLTLFNKSVKNNDMFALTSKVMNM